MNDNTPKAVTNDAELATGDFSDTAEQPAATGAATVQAEPVQLEGVDEGGVIPDAETTSAQVKPSAPAKDEQWREHLEPFWVPLGLRKAQKRDTVAFGLFAILAIVSGAAALLYFQPFGATLSAPSWVGTTAGVVALVSIAGMLIFGMLALVDLTKSERAYYSSTHDWLAARYGIELSKHKVKSLSKHRNSVGGTTGWKIVKLEGYPQGVQITYSERYGYRLISTVDNVETQLPRAAK